MRVVRLLFVLTALASASAVAADKSKSYCARFSRTFDACSLKCVDYVKRQPEFPDAMTKQDFIDAVNGCTSICIESAGFHAQDAVSCDKHR